MGRRQASFRDVEFYLGTEKFDVDFSRGARLLARPTCSARKYAETTELNDIRCSLGQDKDTRDGMVSGLRDLLLSLERAMGMDEATEKGSQRRSGQSMAEWVNVFERAVLDMKAEGFQVNLANMGRHLFEKGNLTLERQERFLAVTEGEHDFTSVRGALIKFFFESIIKFERRALVPKRRPLETSRNTFFKTRDKRTRRCSVLLVGKDVNIHRTFGMMRVLVVLEL